MDTTADASQGWMTSGPGAQRRILCQDKALMMVEFMFEKDGVGVPHSHPMCRRPSCPLASSNSPLGATRRS